MNTVLAPRASSILYDVLGTRRTGERFLLPANICPIVPAVFAKAGMAVEFVDIDPSTLEMDLEAAERRLRRGGLGGLLYAHTYGDPATPSDFFGSVKGLSEGLLLIDDRCLCVPDLEPPPHMLADISLYSTGYGKIVGLAAGGFAFVGEHMQLSHRPLRFREEDRATLGKSLKLAVSEARAFSYQDADWLQTEGAEASWSDLRARLHTSLEATLAHRASINTVYNRLIPQELRLPDRFQLWRYNVLVPRKESSLAAVFGAGLFASSHYAPLVDIMGPGTGENARELWNSVVNLFNDSHYTVSMAEDTARILLETL